MKKLLSDLFYVGVIVSFSILIVCYSAIFNSYLFEPELYLTQDYSKPFVLRALPVWAMNVLYGWTHYDYIGIFRCLDIISFSLSGWFFYKYTNSFFKNESLAKVLALSIYFVIPFNMLMPRYLPLWYPYDSFGLLFLTMGLYFIRTHRVFWFHVILFVGTFNRETTIILVGVFACVYWGAMTRGRLITYLVAQLALWGGAKLFLNQYFSTNSGQLFEPSFTNNVNFITALQLYNLGLGDLERIFRYIFLLGNFGFIYLIVIVYWKVLDNLFLCRSVVAFTPFFISIVFFGNIFEFRVFGELIPFVLMPVIYIVSKMLYENGIPNQH